MKAPKMMQQAVQAHAPAEGPAPLGAAISLKDLHLGYDRTDVIAGLSLDVQAGEFIALLGASGCGKTTLPRAGRLRAGAAGADPAGRHRP